jgi:GGDEF domain-containing protein
MVRPVADVHHNPLDPCADVLGHVGGDDFVVVFQSEDWHARCSRIVDEFNVAAQGLFDPDGIARGHLRGEDRSGRPAVFPLTSLCIGVVQVAPSGFSHPEEIASIAAAAKRRAKRDKVGVFVLSHEEAQALAPAFGMLP